MLRGLLLMSLSGVKRAKFRRSHIRHVFIELSLRDQLLQAPGIIQGRIRQTRLLASGSLHPKLASRQGTCHKAASEWRKNKRISDGGACREGESQGCVRGLAWAGWVGRPRGRRPGWWMGCVASGNQKNPGGSSGLGRGRIVLPCPTMEKTREVEQV